METSEKMSADDDKPRQNKGRRTRKPTEDEPPTSEAVAPTKSTQDSLMGFGARFRRKRGSDDQQQDDSVSKEGESVSNLNTAGGGGGGGWMDSPVAKPQMRDEQDETIKELPNANPNNKNKYFQEETDEIIVIPDLDEDGAENESERVAHAPRNLTRKIPSRLELEMDLKTSLPSTELGFDLSVLLGTLIPSEQLKDEDVLWTFDSLLREITSEKPIDTEISQA